MHFQWQETGTPFRNHTHNCIRQDINYFSSHHNAKTKEEGIKRGGGWGRREGNEEK
jgi:putative NIF3 family GTP cyclohydrolase 1 type 2